MDHDHMDPFSRRLPMRRGSAAPHDMQLPRTRQDVMLEETSRQSQASVPNSRVPPIKTTIASKIRRNTLESPLSGKNINGDELDEPREKQQDGRNAQESRVADEEEELLVKYPIAPQHCRRWETPEAAVVKRGTIPAGPLHFTNPVPTLPEGWEEHTHLEGKLYYVRDASNAIQGVPFTLTIVTDADPRKHRNTLGLESVHRQVVEATKEQDIRLPTNIQLFIQLYPEQDESWGHIGGYYLADLDNQSVFWVEDTESLDLGLGDKINFGVFGEQHLKLALHRQFWYHIERYPLPGSIDEDREHVDLLKHLTAAMLDVSLSGTPTSLYTATECLALIKTIEKVPRNSRTWQIALIAGSMAEGRFVQYYGHPSARLNRLRTFEVQQTSDQSTQRQRFGDLLAPIITLWYSMVAIWLRLCSVFMFDAPIRHHAALEDLFVDKVVYKKNYTQIMEMLLGDWSDASFLGTVLLTANMAYLAIPKPENVTYTAEHLYLLGTAANTCSLMSTIFSIGSITLGLINTRRHREGLFSQEIIDLLQGARHHHYGFRPLAIIYALPIALLMWAVLSFAGAIALYCLVATTVIPRATVLALAVFLMGCTLTTVWYFWQREIPSADDGCGSVIGSGIGHTFLQNIDHDFDLIWLCPSLSRLHHVSLTLLEPP